jgi:hypothetical protein
MSMRRTRAAVVVCAVAAAVAGCAASGQTPVQRNIAAHPAVACPVIAAQVRALNRYSSFPGPVGDPGAGERELAGEFGNVSSGAGRLAAAEVTFASDVSSLPAGTPGYNSTVAGDVAALARLC